MSTASIVFMLVVMGFVSAMMLWTLQRTLFPPRTKPYESESFDDYPPDFGDEPQAKGHE